MHRPTLQKKKRRWFSKFNDKSGRHDTSNQRSTSHEKEIIFYMSETVSLGIHLTHVHRHMCDIRVGKMSVPVMTTTSLDVSLTVETMKRCTTRRGMFCHSCCNFVKSCYGNVWGGWFFRRTRWAITSHTCSIGFTSGKRADQGNVSTLWRCRNTNMWNMWSSIVMLNNSSVEFHMINNVILQDLVSMSDARSCICYNHKSRPTITMNPTHTWHCHHQNDWLAARSLEYNVPLIRQRCVHQHVTGNKRLIWEQNSPHLARVHPTLWWHHCRRSAKRPEVKTLRRNDLLTIRSAFLSR